MIPRFLPLLLAVALVFGLVAPVRAQYAAWYATPGTISSGDASATDLDGNTYLLGYFCGSAVFDTTTLQAGGHIFNFGCGGGATFLAKISAAGRWQWARQLPLYNGRVATDTSGHVFLAGSFTDSLSVGSTTYHSRGGSDVFVGRLSGATGAWQWLTTAGGPSQDYLTGLAVTPTGAATVAGVFASDSLAFGATVLTDPLVGPDGQGLFLAHLSAGGAWRGAVSAVNPTPIYRWPTTPTTPYLSLDAVGNAYIAGTGGDSAARFGAFTLPVGASYVARLGSGATTWQWAQPVGGWLRALAADDRQVVVAGGFFDSTFTIGATTLVHSAPEPDSLTGYAPEALFVASLDPLTGAWGWATGGGQGEVYAMATGPAGAVYMTGLLRGPATFGTTTLAGPSNQYDNNLFVASLTAAGTARWAVADSAAYAGSSGNSIGVDAAGNAYVGGTEGNHYSPLGWTNGFALVARVAPNGVLAVAAPVRRAAFDLSPNPARSVVRLTGAPQARIELLDIMGRVVRTWPGGQLQADLSGVAPGLYVVRVGTATRRLVVE